MSRHSRAVQARKALEASPPVISKPQGQQVGIENLVPLIIQSGAQVGMTLQYSAADKVIRFVAQAGPIQIPVDIKEMEKVRAFAGELNRLADEFDPPSDQPEEPLRPELEELLAESQAKTADADVSPLDDEHCNSPFDEMWTATTLPQLPASQPSKLILPG